ncbi:MAG: hypothetical protein ACJ749_14270 [Flavisolibacter sp.]
MLSAFQKKKDSVEMIIIGNSHTGAFRQRTIGTLRVMNFSYAGMELQDRFDLMRELFKEKTSVKYVLMAMDYDQIGHKISDAFIHNMFLPYIMNKQEGITRLASSLKPNDFLRHNRDLTILYDYYISGHYNKNDTNFVPLNFTRKDDANGCERRALELSRFNFSAQNIDNNLALIDKIKLFLASKGIHLILLNTPKPNCFDETYFKNLDNSNISILKSFVAKHHIAFFDFAKSNLFKEEDFQDFDHLNMEGSQILCDSLWKAISKTDELALSKNPTTDHAKPGSQF